MTGLNHVLYMIHHSKVIRIKAILFHHRILKLKQIFNDKKQSLSAHTLPALNLILIKLEMPAYHLGY